MARLKKRAAAPAPVVSPVRMNVKRICYCGVDITGVIGRYGHQVPMCPECTAEYIRLGWDHEAWAEVAKERRARRDELSRISAVLN